MILLQLLRYLIYFPFVLIGVITCILFAPIICLAMDKQGNLPWWLKWFQPVDTAYGCIDTLWKLDHPDWSDYKLAYTFIRRNPFYGGCYSPFGAKGFNPVTLGNRLISDTQGISGFYLLVASNGVFQLKIIWHISSTAIIHEAGWQIHDVNHPTFGSYQMAPIRFYKYGT